MANSKETIVEASIKILNRDGLDGLSMRTIAKELGIKAASLYWHFNGKQELYGAIAEYLCLRCKIPEDTGNPQEYLEDLFQVYRSMLLTVRDSSAIFDSSIPNTPMRVEIIRLISDKLTKIGVKNINLMTLSNLLNNYVLSFTADELRIKNASPEALTTFSQMLDPDNKLVFIHDQNFDEQFLYGLRVLFEGAKAIESM